MKNAVYFILLTIHLDSDNLQSELVFTSTEPYTSQLQNYLHEKVENDANFNLIHWWESRQEKYPQLFQLFLKFAFIPATSSMVESEFSYSGLVITDRRNRIKPENVNDIMIARNSCAEILKTRKKKYDFECIINLSFVIRTCICIL